MSRVCILHKIIEHEIPGRDIKKSQPHHHEPHHCTRSESDLQPAIEGTTDRVSRSRGSIRGGFHAKETGQRRKEPTCQKSKRNPIVLKAKIGHGSKKQREDYKNHDHHLVLLFEVRHSPITHMLSDGFHCFGAFALFHHSFKEVIRENQCYY